MIARAYRVWLSTMCLVLFTAAMSRTANAQVPPKISLSTAAGAYVSASPMHETITICVATSLDTLRVFSNGTNVTSSFRDSTSGGCSGGVQYLAGGSVSLNFTQDSLRVYVCELNSMIGHPDVCSTLSIAYRYTYVEVTPKGGAANGHVSEAATEQFTVQNLLASAQTMNLSVSCSGSGVSGCSITTPSSGKLNLAANGSSPVTVSFTAGALNSTGTITVVAKDSAQSAAVDTGSVNFTAAWIIPEVISTAYTNQDDQDLTRCADNCFALRTAMSTVPYTSLDVANGVTLVYNSDQMADRPVLYADVKMAATNPYTLQGFQLSAQYYDPINTVWVKVTFLNGDQVLHFASVTDTLWHRMAGAFSDSALVTNHGQAVYRMLMQVITQYADHADTLNDSTHHLMVMNGRSSPVAKGWSIAGIEQGNWGVGSSPDQNYTMRFRGDGSAYLLGPPVCGTGCIWSADGPGVFAFGQCCTSEPSHVEYADSTRIIGNSSGYTSAIVMRPYDTTYIGYDSQNRVISISDPYRMRPDSNKHTYWVINYGANGISSIVEPDSAGHPGMGRQTNITVNSSGLLTAWQDPDGVSTRFGYDGHNRLDTLYDRKGNATAFAYDSISWKLVRITSPAVLLDNSGTGSPTSQTIVETLTPWQTQGVPITSTGGTPATAMLVSNVIAADSTSAGKTTFTVDRWGQPIKWTNPQGLVTTFAYDINGFDTLIAYPSGAVDSASWNGPFLASSTPAGQSKTQYGYCVWGTLCQVNITGGPSQTMYPNANGHIDSVTVAGSTWHYSGDSLGRTTLAVDPQHDTTKFRYDTHTGNLDSTIAWPSYRFTASTFDGHGRTHTVTVSTPTGPMVVTTTAYDSVNRVVSSTDGLHSTPTRFTYDSLYNTVISDPKGQAYHYAYNSLGWDTTETDTASRTVRATYNNFGAPTTNKNRRLQLVQTLYDSLGRVSKVTRPDAGDSIDYFSYPDSGYNIIDSNRVVKDVTYTSRTTGLVDSVITTFKPNGNWFKRSYTHDALGRVTKVTITSNDSSTFKFNSRAVGYNATTGLIDSLDITSSSNRLTFGYDSLFRLTSTTHPGGVTRTDAYFTSGQLASTSWGAILARNYGYDSTGHVNEVDYGDMRDSTTSTLYQYDVLGELTQAQLIKWTDTATSCPGGQLQNGFGCRYGSSRTDSALQTINYWYDAAGNLDSMHVGSADTIASIATANRLTGWTGLTFTVDSDGNRANTTAGSTTTTYTWGADDRLLTVTQGSNTRSYDYDPSGQLVQRKTNGHIDRYYLWDNGQILAILDSTASHRIAEFVYFGGADQPLARITGASSTDTIHYYAQDALGNVIAQFQGTSIEQSIAYDPWGAATVQHFGSDTTTPPLRWKGLLYEDGITSLYYVRARWYDPETRRFMSPDPLGLAAGINQYAYAGGDPIDGSDPLGTCAIEQLQYTDSNGSSWCLGITWVSFGDFGSVPIPYVVADAPAIPVTAQPGFGPPLQSGPGTSYYGPSPFFAPAGSLGGGGGPAGSTGQTATQCPAMLSNPTIRGALDASWAQSFAFFHTENGFYAQNLIAGIGIERVSSGGGHSMNPPPPPPGAFLFGHSHPNLGGTWFQHLSPGDTLWANANQIGVAAISVDSLFYKPYGGPAVGCAR